MSAISYSTLDVNSLDPSMRTVFDTLINAAQAILHNAEQKREIERLQKENEKLELARQLVQDDNDKFIEALNEKESENCALHQQINSLEISYREEVGKTTSLGIALNKVRSENEDLQITVNDLVERHKRTQERLAEVTARNIVMGQERDMYKDKLRKFREILSAEEEKVVECSAPTHTIGSDDDHDKEPTAFINPTVFLPEASSTECETHRDSVGDNLVSEPSALI